MKFLKKIIKIVFAFIGLILLMILVIIWVDRHRTGYLKIEKNEFANNDSYLITNVNIIPMDRDTVLTDKMVYLKNGIIHKIANNIEINGIEIFDANNRYLMPGLIDMHVHIWDRYELGLYLSNGVTAVRNLWGMPMHLRIKKEINNDEIISPMFFTTGPKLTGPEFLGDDNLQLTSPDEAREKVILFKDRGYDFIKTYYGLTEDIFNAIIQQAIASDIDIVAHPTPKVPYAYHFNSQIKSIEHTEDIIQQPLNYKLDTFKLNEVVDQYADSKHSTHSQTLIVYNNIYQMLIDDHILGSEKLDLMNPLIKMTDSKSQFNRWKNTKMVDASIVNTIKKQHDFHLNIIKQLHAADVTIICGTDSGIGVTVPGFSIHQELAFYKEAGLSNFDVLKTATVNAANTHTAMNNMGSIEEGKIGNLILTDKNPLVDLSTLKKPLTIFVKGRKIDRKTLDIFEINATDRNNVMATAIRYAENLIIER
jgi:hypothetical protein